MSTLQESATRNSAALGGMRARATEEALFARADQWCSADD